MYPFRLFVRAAFSTVIVALFARHVQLINRLHEDIRLEEGVGGGLPGMPASRAERPFVDVLSISSRVGREGLARAQRETWASHGRVRRFVTATEDDDPDPSCAANLTWARVSAISRTCRGHWAGTERAPRNTLTRKFANNFANERWLAKKRDAAAWICAQRRMAAGLAKVGRAYRGAPAGDLPDFLALVDDDTYVNMDRLEEEVLLSNKTEGEVVEEGMDRSAKVYVGCLVVSNPAPLVQFTFPFGGWGTFFSKGAIERLIAPLRCGAGRSVAGRSPFKESACRRLAADHDYSVGERAFFREGMSVSDLMGAVAGVTTEPYCMHSDWGVGYFVNFYNVSGVRWVGPEAKLDWYPRVAQTRMHPLGQQESFIYKKPGGDCQRFGENCDAGSLVCHYVNGTQMRRLWKDRQVRNK